MQRTLAAVSEQTPGNKWKNIFDRSWPSYRSWFLKEGGSARPSYLECARALRRHMPELIPTYEGVVDLAGGGDVEARFLSLYRPTPYLTGCSQAVWRGAPEPTLVRNYDYSPRLWDGTMFHSAWHGRRVIAMTDCVWGVLDGISEAGLAVSLSFGGRKVVGDGFGIPLVLRYVLEFADNLSDAVRMLQRVPTHMAYNVTVLDHRGRSRTVHLSPDRPAMVTRKTVATNHQVWLEWTEYVRATRSVERADLIDKLLKDRKGDRQAFIDSFLAEPLYSHRFEEGWGTLYTAMYTPSSGRVTLRWPDSLFEQSLDNFHEGSVPLSYAGEVPPPAEDQDDPPINELMYHTDYRPV